MRTLIISMLILLGAATFVPEAEARDRRHYRKHHGRYYHSYPRYTHYPRYYSYPRYRSRYYYAPSRYYYSDYGYPRYYRSSRPRVHLSFGF